jgi:hypothetical protein
MRQDLSVCSRPSSAERVADRAQRQVGGRQRDAQFAGGQQHHRQRRVRTRGDVFGVAAEGDAGLD